MTVYPCYVLTHSDSQGEGFNLDNTPIDMDTVFGGIFTAGPLSDVWIWNNSNTAFELLEHQVQDTSNQNNMSTSIEAGFPMPAVTTEENGPFIGPELSLMYYLQEYHAGPVFLIKFCRSFSVLGVDLGPNDIEWSPASADAAPLFERMWDVSTGRVKAATDQALLQSGGGYPSDVTGLEVRAIFQVLGYNDCADATNTAAFAANQLLLIDTARARLATLGLGVAGTVPYVISLLHKDARPSFAANVQTVRNAQFAAEAARDGVLLADPSEIALATDDIHFNAAEQIPHGALLYHTYIASLEPRLSSSGGMASQRVEAGSAASQRAQAGRGAAQRVEAGAATSARRES